MAVFEKRTSQSGDVTHRVKVRLRGHPTQSGTFKRLTDAKIWAIQTEASIREGRYFKTSESKRHTLADLVDRYCRDVIPTKKPEQQENYAKHLRWWKERYGHLILSDFTSAKITEGRDALLNEFSKNKKPRANATVAKSLAILSHALTTAINEWMWLQDNPAKKVRKPQLPLGRVRFLDDDERTRLLKACHESRNSYLYPVVILALATGMRQGEIMNLRWPDVDLKKGFIILHKTKNNERRRVPLVGPALEALKKHAEVRRIDTDLLWPGKDPQKPISLKRPWLNAVHLASIEDFRFHDLRHSCASYLAMNGATSGEIAEVLGHKTLNMVKRYAHLSDNHIKGVLERMAEKVF